MPADLLRIVLDTNTLLRGFIAPSSAAARIRRAAEARVLIPLLSKSVVDEYRATLLHENITRRFPDITREVVELTFQRLLFVGDYIRQPAVHFDFPRDPDDEKFIELAMELAATHLLTSDHDLLSLPHSPGNAGRRFRQRLRNIEVLDARDFLKMHHIERLM